VAVGPVVAVGSMVAVRVGVTCGASVAVGPGSRLELGRSGRDGYNCQLGGVKRRHDHFGRGGRNGWGAIRIVLHAFLQGFIHFVSADRDAAFLSFLADQAVIDQQVMTCWPSRRCC